MELEIITPLKVVYSDKIKNAVLPSVMGEMGVLPGHANFIVALKSGVIQVSNSSGENLKFTLSSGGLAEIFSDKVLVVTQEVSAS
jgi:F-type H+-transporting ATPase subunit epsilon